jgi:hypothetical protein
MSGDSIRGMCCDKSEIFLNDFLRYLSDRELSICNFTKSNFIYWPVDSEKVIQGFIKSQMEK